MVNDFVVSCSPVRSYPTAALTLSDAVTGRPGSSNSAFSPSSTSTPTDVDVAVLFSWDELVEVANSGVISPRCPDPLRYGGVAMTAMGTGAPNDVVGTHCRLSTSDATFRHVFESPVSRTLSIVSVLGSRARNGRPAPAGS